MGILLGISYLFGGAYIKIRHPRLGSGCALLGGEFVVILPNISPKDANTLAQRLRRKVSEITTDTIPIAITISIGISRFDTAKLFERGL